MANLLANLPWKHIITASGAFLGAYALTQSAMGYDSVALHWSWRAILMGLGASGLYTGGLVQAPPTK